MPYFSFAVRRWAGVITGTGPLRRTWVLYVLIGAFVFAPPAAFAGSTVGADESAPIESRKLLDSLRAGGFNIYFRHAQTDWSLSDQVDSAGDWISCDPARMRQLSGQGIQASRSIGEAIRMLEIPVGRVLASPYCRTVRTAELMELGPVETTTDVMNLRSAEFFGGREAIVRRARARLAIAPPEGTNVVLVAHGNVAREATAVYPGEAEAVIFRPDGKGGFVFSGRIKPDQWLQLTGPAAD